MTSLNADDTYEEFDARYLLREAWRDWTPAVDQNGNVAVTVTSARYIVLARTVHLLIELAVTGTGVAGNSIIISGVPAAIQPTNTGGTVTIGSGTIFDTGTAFYAGSLIAVGADDLRIVAHNAGSYIGASPSFALANGDVISFQATYER